MAFLQYTLTLTLNSHDLDFTKQAGAHLDQRRQLEEKVLQDKHVGEDMADADLARGIWLFAGCCWLVGIRFRDVWVGQ